DCDSQESDGQESGDTESDGQESDDIESDESDSEYEICTLTVDRPHTPAILVEVLLQHQFVNGQYDSGANAEAVSRGLCTKLSIKCTRISQSFKQLLDSRKFIGRTDVTTQIGRIQRIVHYHVLDTDADVLLIGREAIVNFMLEQNK